MNDKKSPVIANPWEGLRQFTDARIALGRAGVSLPTTAHLSFQLAHAQARDAVHLALDLPALARVLSASPQADHRSCLLLHSAAAERRVYLQRPDLGRRLDAASRLTLETLNIPAGPPSARPYDLAFVVADGLSARAIELNAAPFLDILWHHIASDKLSIAPISIVAQARVAIGDEVGELLGAKAVVVMIGERPGLSSPDSMGLYLTWMPRVGLTDASRNCISNVRPAGLGYEEAACKLRYLLSEMYRRKLSGVELKDETGPELPAAGSKNFLLE